MESTYTVIADFAAVLNIGVFESNIRPDVPSHESGILTNINSLITQVDSKILLCANRSELLSAYTL
jgi:hypothetical protein